MRARYARLGLWLDQMPYCYSPTWEPIDGFYSGAFPPLLIWLMAVSSAVLGETTFAMRLPVALMGTATIWTMFFWGRVNRNLATGLWAAFIPAAVFFFVEYMRRAQFDLPITFFILLTVFLGTLYYKHNRIHWLILAAVAMGIGLMTKILIAGFAAVALLIGAGVLWIRGEIRFRRIVIDQVILNAIGIGIAMPWHVYMILKYRAPDGGLIRGNRFLDAFWGYHVNRRMEQVEGKNLDEWYFYITTAWERIEPVWTVLFGVAFVWALVRVVRWTIDGARSRGDRNEVARGETRWSDDHALVFPLAWAVFVFVLLTTAQHKYKTYLVPMIPPFAMLTAQLLDRAWRERMAAWPRRLLAFVVIYLIIVSRTTDHWKELAMWMQWPIKPMRVLGVVLPFLIPAALIVAACEIAARYWKRFSRATVIVMLAMIVFHGFHSGIRKDFKRRYFHDSRWTVVKKELDSPDVRKLIYLGTPTMPDHYYYLDAINAEWDDGFRDDVEYVEKNPVDIEDFDPLSAEPGTLLVIENNWAAEADWSPEEEEALLRDFRQIHRNEYLSVYKPK